MKHEDDRRILEDWPEAKIITAKQDCRLGDHFHKIKTERFVLVHGSAIITIDGAWNQMEQGILYTVYPGQGHAFNLTKGSVLIGLCSHVYDPTDDYKIAL